VGKESRSRRFHHAPANATGNYQLLIPKTTAPVRLTIEHPSFAKKSIELSVHEREMVQEDIMLKPKSNIVIRFLQGIIELITFWRK